MNERSTTAKLPFLGTLGEWRSSTTSHWKTLSKQRTNCRSTTNSTHKLSVLVEGEKGWQNEIGHLLYFGFGCVCALNLQRLLRWQWTWFWFSPNVLQLSKRKKEEVVDTSSRAHTCKDKQRCRKLVGCNKLEINKQRLYYLGMLFLFTTLFFLSRLSMQTVSEVCLHSNCRQLEHKPKLNIVKSPSSEEDGPREESTSPRKGHLSLPLLPTRQVRSPALVQSKWQPAKDGRRMEKQAKSKANKW